MLTNYNLIGTHFPTSHSGTPETSGIPRFVRLIIYSTKEAQPEEDPSVSARLQRLQNNYEDFGMRRTVEGILVVHDHGHPHILMLQIANAFFKLYHTPFDNYIDFTNSHAASDQATTSPTMPPKSRVSKCASTSASHLLAPFPPPRTPTGTSATQYPNGGAPTSKPSCILISRRTSRDPRSRRNSTSSSSRSPKS